MKGHNEHVIMGIVHMIKSFCWGLIALAMLMNMPGMVGYLTSLFKH